MQPVLLFPKSDSGLLVWSQNVVDLITPVPATWGLVTLDVTNYTADHNSYKTALTACAPSVRSKPAVVTKNAARDALKLAALVIANKIYATPSVTDSMKVEIGMPPRATPTQIPAPTIQPTIEVVETSGTTVYLRLRGGDGRGLPPGTIGASVFSAVSATPPGDITGWTFQGNIGRVNKIAIPFPDTVAAGAKIWFTSFYFNGRKQSGPAATPLGINLPGGGVAMSA